jgi:hypothetical protein
MWKTFGGVMAGLWVLGITEIGLDGRLDPDEMISLPIDTVGTVGLLLYAFRHASRVPLFWHYFAPGFAVWSVLSLIIDWVREAAAFVGPASAILALTSCGVLSYFNWIALRRLGRPSTELST